MLSAASRTRVAIGIFLFALSIMASSAVATGVYGRPVAGLPVIALGLAVLSGLLLYLVVRRGHGRFLAMGIGTLLLLAGPFWLSTGALVCGCPAPDPAVARPEPPFGVLLPVVASIVAGSLVTGGAVIRGASVQSAVGACAIPSVGGGAGHLSGYPAPASHTAPDSGVSPAAGRRRAADRNRRL